MTYRYRVYDTQTDEWLPGDYNSGELREAIGFAANFSKYAGSECLVGRRYRVIISDGKMDSASNRRFAPSLLREWDEVRLEILRIGGRDV